MEIIGLSDINSVLGLLVVPKAYIESQSDQVGNMPGLWVGSGVGCCHDVMDDSNRDGLLLIDW